jgi:hypothetical protein
LKLLDANQGGGYGFPVRDFDYPPKKLVHLVSDSAELDRRAALKKAAAAAAGAGAVWTAPKVQGLSLSPNFAAAGGAGSSVTITRASSECPGFFDSTDTFGVCNGNNPQAATVTTAAFGAPSTPCVSKITFTGRADSDGSGDISAVTDGVSSANCVISAISFSPGGYADSVNGIGGNIVSYQADNFNTQANNVTVTITC